MPVEMSVASPTVKDRGEHRRSARINTPATTSAARGTGHASIGKRIAAMPPRVRITKVGRSSSRQHVRFPPHLPSPITASTPPHLHTSYVSAVLLFISCAFFPPGLPFSASVA